MLGSFIKKNLAGPGYIILNVIRICNLITLTAVAVASMIMLVKTFTVSRFFFFDGVNHLITTGIAVFLFINEAGWFKNYFNNNWPLLGMNHSLLSFGLVMEALGVSTLGNLNKDATSANNLGERPWQVVIASGIVAMIMGAITIVANYLFRQKAHGITARMIRKDGAVAQNSLPVVETYNKEISSMSDRSNSFRSQGQHSYVVSAVSGSVRGHGPVSPMSRTNTLPSYYNGGRSQSRMSRMRSASRPRPASSRYSISAPTIIDPEQFAKFEGKTEEIKKPDLAAHPAFHGGQF